ncbi:MAG: Omp28 family outer membrane lipoprotein [Bacteroidales bacterium]|nr:Omp28 family outer membrane lipoprotein [Bacteroidales bacterium]
MNKILFPLALGLTFTLTLASCDDISPDDRYIEVEAIEPQRAVLLEEFTGQLCVNCPLGHETIEKLKEQYGEALVAVSIHAGGSAFSIGEDEIAGVVGLRLDEGETYASNAGAQSYPSGRVNREYSIANYDTWGTDIREALQQTSTVELEASATADGDDITIEVKALSSSSYTGNLQVWVVEDGIVAMQLQPDSSVDLTYVHNNVFRGSVNGTNGEAVSITSGIYLTKTYEITKKDNWNIDNLSIVVFLYSTAGVENVVQVAVENEVTNQ